MIHKLKSLFQRHRLDAEMTAEMRHHVELLTESNVKAGMDPEEARYAAQRKFGNLTGIQEQMRDVRSGMRLERMVQDMLVDLRFAFRTLASNRGFALVTVLTLALGMGSAAAIFSVSDRVLFRPNEFPKNVFLIGGRTDQHPFMPIRFDFMARAYVDQANHVLEIAKAAPMTGNVVLDGQPVATSWLGVSVDLFPMLGASTVLGRSFLASEAIEGSDHVAIVSHEFWQNRLGGASDVLGRKVTVGDSVCTVVGVVAEWTLPAYFLNDIYRPLSYRVHPSRPWAPNLLLLGRLRAGVTRDQAAQALAAIKPETPVGMRTYLEGDRPVLSPLSELNQAFRPQVYWILLGAVGFLYAIAVLNASNLMLVRMLGRRQELAIRFSLGGGRWRIIQLLAMESVTLTGLASLSGLLVAYWLFPLLLNAAAGFTASWVTSWSLDWAMAGALGALAVATSLLLIVVPVIRIYRTDIYPNMKQGGAALGESPKLRNLRGLLVVLQAAFAVILLSGAGLMIRTFQHLREIDMGFDPHGLAKVLVSFPSSYETGNAAHLARLLEIQERLRRIPGVRDVGFGTNFLLLGNHHADHALEAADGKPLASSMGLFSAGFQNVSGLQLKRGRWFDETSRNEVMVNESLARRRWPGQNPVGQILRELSETGKAPQSKGWVVVGEVGDIRATVRESPGLFVYGPAAWSPRVLDTFIVRLSEEYDELAGAKIQRELYAFDPRLIVTQVTGMNRLRDQQLWAEKLADSVLKVLAGMAVLLTVVGVFSVLAYTVDRRMGEFGVRVALGATRRDLMELVMRRGVALSLGGIVLGIAGALTLTRHLQSLLFDISAQDPKVILAVGVLLLLTSVLACILPARRAAKVDPMIALRAE